MTLAQRIVLALLIGTFGIGGAASSSAQAVAWNQPDVLNHQWSDEALSNKVAFELAPIGKDDLVVHEWGVFTVFNDVKYANVNRKEEWGSLPSFFYRQFPKERLRWQPSGWDKPVIYFYAKPQTLQVTVKVTFAEGAPVVWWPAVASPVDDPFAREPKPARPFRSLTWQAWLGDEVPPLRGGKGPLLKVEDFPLPPGSWLHDARLPGASRLTVVGNVETMEGKPVRKFPGVLDRYETERFLYYDGLVPAPDYLRCDKVDGQSVTLRNQAKFDMAHLFVVDRRQKDSVRFAFVDASRPPFKAGTSMKFDTQLVPAKDWPAAGIKQVRLSLLEAGLFDAEADSLLKIWQKGFFEADGVTVFHILPVSEYDRMLPLEIRPAPVARPVRVGIALHPHREIDPGLTARVAGLVRQLDDDDVQKREAATKELLAIGFPVISPLRAELRKNPSAEVINRIHAVLARVEITLDTLKSVAPAKNMEK